MKKKIYIEMQGEKIQTLKKFGKAREKKLKN